MQDDVLRLAYEVSRITEEKVGLIDGVMRRTGLLALNARLEAARAGHNGQAFGVVAQEMSAVAADIRRIGGELRGAVAANIDKLEEAGSRMLFELRGERFADLARNAVEIIDRNLYERSCDVRWWATDSAMVAALERPGAESARHACDRLATILRSYTVYLDLWVADRHGRVVATGRPDLYRGTIGSDVGHQPWFAQGMATASGDEFAVCDIAKQPQLGDRAVATYATAVRRGGRPDGERLGALGIFFDWAPQAAAVVAGASLGAEERGARVMLLDAGFRVIAASDGRGLLEERYPLQTGGRTRGCYRDGERIVAFACTPGYETYRGLGWWGCIEHRLDAAG